MFWDMILCVQAVYARDALSKAIYGRLFSWIIHKINDSIKVKSKQKRKCMGVLDIYGFEIFEVSVSVKLRPHEQVFLVTFTLTRKTCPCGRVNSVKFAWLVEPAWLKAGQHSFSTSDLLAQQWTHACVDAQQWKHAKNLRTRPMGEQWWRLGPMSTTSELGHLAMPTNFLA